jgi:Ca2+-binding EF-hand superfamily protein
MVMAARRLVQALVHMEVDLNQDTRELQVTAVLPQLTNKDHHRSPDPLLVQLCQMALIQLYGHSSRQLTKMVSWRTAMSHNFHSFHVTNKHPFLGSGQLSESELRAALVNGDWSSFDPQTVKMMIRMFDSDRSGLIGFDEFCGLWGFLAAWRSLFDRFDVDRSGNISLSEYTDALVAFGYRLSPHFVDTLFRTFDKRNEGAISFDLFVQSCISLKRMTDVFKKYDDDRDGYITLSL